MDQLMVPSAISNTFVLAIDSAAAATSSASVPLPGVAVRGETLGRARQLLLVTRSFVLTDNGGPYHATFRVPSLGSSEATAVASSAGEPRWEPWYVEAASGAEEAPDPVVIRADCEGDGGPQEQENNEKRGFHI
ncbi:sorbitol dehydrogenase-like [Dorcoceras hygrometricum]|uniref:Sorbitol dehydrogenase-like n=1 Tax=Dorcoceras hygrometricum TaxID=472368 RepID=A0A2Z7A2P9_9LAMI|nr:sorbitol dehydrogenase-like [Dorcoceras hygrometricum]